MHIVLMDYGCGPFLYMTFSSTFPPVVCAWTRSSKEDRGPNTQIPRESRKNIHGLYSACKRGTISGDSSKYIDGNGHKNGSMWCILQQESSFLDSVRGFLKT
jgi:hypothetical protein